MPETSANMATFTQKILLNYDSKFSEDLPCELMREGQNYEAREELSKPRRHKPGSAEGHFPQATSTKQQQIKIAQ